MKAPECPKCNVSLNRYRNFGTKQIEPRPGDLSICLHCGELLRFTNVGIGKLAPELLEKLPEDQRFQLLEMQRMIRANHN